MGPMAALSRRLTAPGYHGVRADRHGPNLSAPKFLELAADFRLRSGRQGHRVPDGTADEFATDSPVEEAVLSRTRL